MKVFLDTQVLIEKNFKYSNPSFRNLVRLVNENEIHLISTEVVDKEIESKIIELVQDNVSQAQTAFARKAKILKNLPEYQNLFIPIREKEEKIKADLLNQYKDFKEELKMTVLAVDGVSSSEVFERYFNKKAPFSDKKKHEFPDAFTLLVLEQECRTSGDPLHIISKDQDLLNYCESAENLNLYPAIEKFLNHCNSILDRKYTQLLIEVCTEYKYEIIEKIMEAVIQNDIAVADADGSIDNLTLSEAEFLEEPNLLQIDRERNKALLSVEVEIRVEGEAFVTDYENSPYDSEEKEYLFLMDKLIAYHDVITIPVIFSVNYETLDFSAHDPIDFDPEHIPSIIENIEINEGNAIEISVEIPYEYHQFHNFR